MNDWKTGKRIGAGFGVTILLIFAFGCFAYLQLRTIHGAASALAEDSFPGVATMGQLQIAAATQYESLEEYVNTNVVNAMLGNAGGAEAKSEKARMEKAIADASRESEEFLGQYEKTIVTPEDRSLFEVIKSAHAPYAECFKKIMDVSVAGKHDAALNLINTQLKPLRRKLADAIVAEVALNKNHGDESCKQIMASVQQTSTGILIALLLAVGIGIGVSVLVTRSIAVPLAAAVAQLDEIADGNLSKDADAAFQLRGDEIGMLARAMQKMIVSLRTTIREVAGGIQVISTSSAELKSSSGQMSTGASHASDKAHSVAAAAEQMSVNITSVAGSMNMAATNLTQVASATENMTSMIGEIAGNSEKARRITGEATKQAERITKQINHLGDAAREIGKVTEAITEISSQTNLLALNATIEAARAGAAGKGFAVVATEIKALAQQTASATEDIRARIEGVQTATASGITEITKVSKIIEEVTDIVGSIAMAIEEQSQATVTMAQNINTASSGVSEANTRVAETSNASREIARDILDVDHAAGEMANGTGHVQSSASELAAVAETLKLTVARFRS